MTYAADANLADYVTGGSGGWHAVREVSELLLALYGTYFDAVKERMEFTSRYQEYLKQRNTIEPGLYLKE